MGGGVVFSASPATTSVQTGSIDRLYYDPFKFTVPDGVRILKIDLIVNDVPGKPSYVGVTPGSIHELEMEEYAPQITVTYTVKCSTHNKSYIAARFPVAGGPTVTYRISWSPEINTHTPDVTDY